MIRMPDFSHMSLSPKPVSPTSLWAFGGRFQICFKTKVVAQVLHSKAQGFLCLCLLKSPIDAGNQEWHHLEKGGDMEFLEEVL